MEYISKCYLEWVRYSFLPSPLSSFFFLSSPFLCFFTSHQHTTQHQPNNTNTPTLKHSNQHSNTPTHQHSNTPTQQHINKATQQHINKATQQHINTATHQHRGFQKSHSCTSQINPSLHLLHEFTSLLTNFLILNLPN
jgi:hypothetical protein